MEMIWSIKLYKTKLGYKVKIEGKDGQADAAEAKLVIKPWLTSNADTK